MIAYTVYRFYKRYDEFEEMSLDSKYNRTKEFNKIIIDFKAIKTKKEKHNSTRSYKSGYDTDGELNKAKKAKFDHKQFELVNKTDEQLKQDEETKDLKLTALPKWLSSKNDFNEVAKLINDIRDDRNNVKPCSGDKNVFDDSEKLINDISNNKVKKESVVF